MASDSAASAAQELLRDSFTRLIEHVADLTDGLTADVGDYRPAEDANSIAWLIWHSARVQDAQVAPLAGVPEVWTDDGWVDRFGLDLPRGDTGYGHDAEAAGKVRAPAELLTSEGLAKVIDKRWTPAVTAGARLVSVIDDCAQHLGAAAYVRGIAPTS
jgi:Protein of unknown function (DUF664)